MNMYAYSAAKLKAANRSSFVFFFLITTQKSYKLNVFFMLKS